MSREDDDESCSDYNDDSFDNESIEEVSENDSACSSRSDEEVLLEADGDEDKSSTGSLNDKPLSLEGEENDLSSLNLDEDDNAISQLLQRTNGAAPGKAAVNEHEIDESETDDENESEIAENIKSLSIENKKEHKSESESIPPTSERAAEDCNDDDAESCTTTTDQPQIEFEIRSDTPTSYNSENHAFHVDILKEQERYIASKRRVEKKSRNSSRKSLSFSNERMREIERHNQILLRKILTQKPRKEAHSTPSPRASSSAVNRKKQQRQIDIDNQVLKRKLEAIASRRRNVFQ